LLGRALALGLEHRLRHLLDEQGDAISALDNVLSDAGRKQLVANDPVYHGADFSLRQSIEREGGHVRSSDPGRLELRPERHDQQRAEARDPIHEPTENFQARRVGPMRILQDHQHRILTCQCFHSGT
jgi:calcineurin-like phosphoesterase family protein